MKTDHSQYLRCLEALKEIGLFKQIDTTSLKDLLDSMHLHSWEKGSFENNIDLQFEFNVILSGRVKVYQCNPKTAREHTILILSKGDVFDLLGLIDSTPHNLYWEALDKIQILTIPTKQMNEWITKYPHIQSSIFRYLGKEIRQLEDAKTDVCLYGTMVRLAQLLLHNISDCSGQLNLINDLPNEEIASLIGTTRAVVNRHLQELKKCGAIKLYRKNIVVQNVGLLHSIAQEKYLP
jgi:CRP/FNR family transcriptional regulator